MHVSKAVAFVQIMQYNRCNPKKKIPQTATFNALKAFFPARTSLILRSLYHSMLHYSILYETNDVGSGQFDVPKSGLKASANGRRCARAGDAGREPAI